MHKPSTATALEKYSGSLPIEIGATLLALTGHPLAPLLPVLVKSLASRRLSERLDIFVKQVCEVLQRHEDILRDLTDAQFKLLNESILAALHTTQSEKLGMLRNAVQRTLFMGDVEPQEAIVLSRIIRDISVEEAQFVLKYFGFRFIHVAESSDSDESSTLRVKPGSQEEFLVGSLTSLGVLTTGQPTFGQQLRFSEITAKFITLLRENA